ncbi:MAG: hypothetical protein L0I62_00930 [Gammaproteobacteria bacterium]|nr:hypothetical protein [Gammaproteobacteria bacterium]
MPTGGKNEQAVYTAYTRDREGGAAANAREFSRLSGRLRRHSKAFLRRPVAASGVSCSDGTDAAYADFMGKAHERLATSRTQTTTQGPR